MEKNGSEQNVYLRTDENNTGAEEKTQITEEVEAGKVGRTDINKYLGIVIDEKGDLEEHIKEKTKVVKVLVIQIRTLGSAQQCRTEYHRVRIRAI